MQHRLPSTLVVVAMLPSTLSTGGGLGQVQSTIGPAAEATVYNVPMPPSLPPQGPSHAGIHNFFMQAGGALLAICALAPPLLRSRACVLTVLRIVLSVGVSISVFGLHGMKLHGSCGQVLRCSKPRRWYGYVVLWGFGQFAQLLSVKLAAEPVVTAVTNFAIIVNAVLAHRMLGEVITRVDGLAIAVMTIGACLVVTFVPQPALKSLTMRDLHELFANSPCVPLCRPATLLALCPAIANLPLAMSLSVAL